ncbi:MAG: hypothetical protein AAFQ36_05890 [Pseudomonadota bacterium]
MVWRRFLLLPLLALALLTSGLHRAPSLDPVQFISGPFGLPMVICGPGAEDGSHHSTACEACAFAAALPTPAPSGAPECTNYVAVAAPLSGSQSLPSVTPTGNTPRAPPLPV